MKTDHRGWFGLHSSIWKIASTHVVVDAYNNIYAPLLPLLIPALNLSLGAAGVIAKPFDPISLPREVAAITAR